MARDSKGTWGFGAPENLESTVIPTEFPTANQIPQTDGEVQGNLLREQIFLVVIKEVGVEIKIESLFQDRTCSWVRIVIGINKDVTET